MVSHNLSAPWGGKSHSLPGSQCSGHQTDQVLAPGPAPPGLCRATGLLLVMAMQYLLGCSIIPIWHNKRTFKEKLDLKEIQYILDCMLGTHFFLSVLNFEEKASSTVNNWFTGSLELPQRRTVACSFNSLSSKADQIQSTKSYPNAKITVAVNHNKQYSTGKEWPVLKPVPLQFASLLVKRL